MTLAACLALYGLLMAVAAPRLLLRHAGPGHAPRLEIACWLLAVISVLATWLAAVALVVGEAAMLGGVDALVQACAAMLGATGPTGSVQRGLALGLAAVLVVAVVLVAWRFARAVLAARRASQRHARAARLVGRSSPQFGPRTVVLDAPDRAAYCVGGRRGTVVVTAGAISSLSGSELDAVLAHERAHVAGRHHLVLTVLGALRRTLGGLSLFARAHDEVTRLLEMRADDVAARRHGRAPMLAALLEMSGGGTPQGAIGAATVGVLARAHRLAEPATPRRRAAARRDMAGSLAALALGPALALTVMTLAVCPMMPG